MTVPYVALDEVDLAGKTLIMRVDFNSPVEAAGEDLVLRDTTRIDDHLHTSIVPLFELPGPPRNIVLLAHQGRPGRDDCTALLPHFAYCRDKLRPKGIETALRVGKGATAKPSDRWARRRWRPTTPWRASAACRSAPCCCLRTSASARRNPG